MAVGKAPRTISISVPRHNSQVIGAKLDAEIKKQAKAKRIRTDTNQPSAELAQAIENASEWNSLLMTARAERGPQWDIGTQQFHVEEGSDLYYDATVLFEATKRAIDEERGITPEQRQAQQNQQQHQQQLQQQQQQQQHHHQQQQQQQQQQGHPTQHQQQYQPPRNQSPNYPPQIGGHPMNQHQGHFQAGGYPGSPGMNMRGPPGGGQFTGGQPQFNPMSQQQFFGGNPPSPMRMGTMGGMTMEDQNLGGPRPGMGGMNPAVGMQNMGGSPSVGRRMTRGMTEDFGMN
ncbi:hypothetical protein FA15DRAFT_701264 [Coprinopsis marcescibilis]|uniref:Uncharacterized protein n=1 Tax=Coprinopsis marcescibilis TaxID=230819 RepID=A0A5C3L5Z1_COPMA|nr:hypothetical protein FA15DRAFT_701264 [Coprinopsis marcescibilis]